MLYFKFHENRTINKKFEMQGGEGRLFFFITFEPNNTYRCSISSFMKIGREIKNLKIGGVGGGLISFISRAPPLI